MTRAASIWQAAFVVAENGINRDTRRNQLKPRTQLVANESPESREGTKDGLNAIFGRARVRHSECAKALAEPSAKRARSIFFH